MDSKGLEITNGVILNPGQKTVISFRCNASLKNRLNSASLQRNITTSELIEHLLTTYHQHETALAEARQENSDLKQQLVERSAIKADLEEARNVINEQEKRMKVLSQVSDITQDQRLVYMFEHLKGKTDTVENAYGANFEITYHSTREVLKAIIYNTKLNQ